MPTINFQDVPRCIYSGLTKKEQMDKLDEIDHPIAFIPKAMIDNKEVAGLLAHLAFRGLPIPVNRNSGRSFKKFALRFTAAGTAPVSHRIPMLVRVGIGQLWNHFRRQNYGLFTTDYTDKR